MLGSCWRLQTSTAYFKDTTLFPQTSLHRLHLVHVCRDYVLLYDSKPVTCYHQKLVRKDRGRECLVCL